MEHGRKSFFVAAFCSLLLSTIAITDHTTSWQQLDASDADVFKNAAAAVLEADKQSNSLYRTELLDLLDAKVQVDAGFRYRYEFIGVQSTCMLNEMLEACTWNGNTKQCFLEVWQQPWTKSLQITANHCTTEVEEFPVGGDNHDIGSFGAFEEFKQKFNKKYASEEEETRRFRIFRENMKLANELNKMELGSARYGSTHLADLTREEFQKFYTSGQWNTEFDPSLEQAEIPTETPPETWDWRDHNAVSSVKNQGSCGSCWAFSVTGNVEGQWAIKRGNLTSLSEQELVDCDKIDEGCNGGLPTNAYKEIIRIGGLESESDYPYEGKDDKCEFNKSETIVKINGALNISSDEEDMKAWLWKNGPISIGINAMAMQFYIGGVAHPWSIFCSPDYLDHGVLIVGYGVKSGLFSEKPYWIIKNSWGTWWGEKGYYLLYRGTGVCGVNRMCTSSVVN